MQVVTAEQAIDFTHPQLSVIKKEAGEVIAKTILVEALTDLVMLFNIGKTMNPPQIIQTIDLILQKYWYLRLTELKYCFNQAKMGAYGKVYDRIDGAIIFEWIEKYIEERKELIIQKQVERNKESKKDVSILEAFSEKGIKFEPKIVESKEEKKVVEKTEREKVIQDAFKEFDKLHLTSEVDSKGIKFIEYQGKIVDIVKFTELKLFEYDSANKDN